MDQEKERDFNFCAFKEEKWENDKELEKLVRKNLYDNLCNTFKNEDKDSSFDKRFWVNEFVNHRESICKALALGNKEVESMYFKVFDSVYERFRNKLHRDFKKLVGEDQYKERLSGILFEKIYECIKYFEGTTEGACLYFKTTEGINFVLDRISYNKEEKLDFFNIYMETYEKVCKLFEGQIQRENMQYEIKQEKKRKKEPFTIFGVHWLLVIFMFPVVIISELFKNSKKR